MEKPMCEQNVSSLDVRLYDHLPTGFLLIDNYGKISFANRYVSRILKQKHLVDKNFYDLIDPNDHSQLAMKLNDIVNLKFPEVSFNLGVTIENRRKAWIKCQAQLAKASHKQVLLHIHDMTKKKRLLQLSDMQENILSLIVKGDSFPSILTALTRSIEDQVNKNAACAIHFYDESNDQISKIIAPNIPGEYSKLLEGIQVGPRIGACVTAIYRKETVIASDIQVNKMWSDLRNVVKESGYMSCWSTPIYKNNRLVGSFSIYFNDSTYPSGSDMKLLHTCASLVSIILERRNLINFVRKESETKLRSLFDHHPNAVFALDLKGRITSVNPSIYRIYGYHVGKLIGEPLEMIISPSSKDNFYKGLQSALHGKTYKVELNTISKEQSIVAVNGSMVPIIVDEDIIGVYADFQDITDQKKTDELLRESDKLRQVGQLAAGIVHEIRNPLTTLKGFSRLMESGEVNTEYFSIIHSEIERIEQIVNEFLMLSKPKGSQTFHKKNIVSIVRDILIMLEPQALLRGIRIRYQFSATELFVECDENQLKQVLINIVKNAFEAMETSGILTVTVRMNSDLRKVGIQFIDTGVGIPDDSLNKIGQPFYTTKESGTGLGMMISRQIVEQHNGKIHIESVLNEGTKVEVNLPTVK